MSDTPRTDAVLSAAVDEPDGTESLAYKRAILDLARQLERELAEARAALRNDRPTVQ